MAEVEDFGRLTVWGMLKGMLNRDVSIFVRSGAPTDGTSGSYAGKAGIGALVIDYTNGILYINAGTKASPAYTPAPGLAALDGDNVALNANSNVIGSIDLVHRIPVPAGATGDVDTVLTYKSRVIDAWLVKTNANGGGAGTIQVLNGSNAITNAMSIDINDTTIARATQINDANHEIAAGGTLKITRTRTASTDETCIVYVRVVRVA